MLYYKVTLLNEVKSNGTKRIGAPIGNKKAVTTGEFGSIWMDTLEEEEQELGVVVPIDKLLSTKIEESDIRVIDDLLPLEDALTRVQDKKLKAIELKDQFVDAERDLRFQKLQARSEHFEQ
ncbi:hypothetical protein [Paenibacillus aceris]|uniref:Uncharacterized protein YjcR n=1 Tax=Paenibacillus aceris TaxID=869555 RepID=A0ABS4HRD1_9BACL|nr:hypothetical protein [Paenibacillus aceris]MBP1961172.1 uncharacterized protein YjcR [Paenibacillus aceris]